MNTLGFIDYFSGTYVYMIDDKISYADRLGYGLLLIVTCTILAYVIVWRCKQIYRIGLVCKQWFYPNCFIKYEVCKKCKKSNFMMLDKNICQECYYHYNTTSKMYTKLNEALLKCKTCSTYSNSYYLCNKCSNMLLANNTNSMTRNIIRDKVLIFIYEYLMINKGIFCPERLMQYRTKSNPKLKNVFITDSCKSIIHKIYNYQLHNNLDGVRQQIIKLLNNSVSSTLEVAKIGKHENITLKLYNTIDYSPDVLQKYKKEKFITLLSSEDY